MSVGLSPIFNGFQGFSIAGIPLAGGLISTYLAGTSTPSATFTDNTGGTPNANPIQLDSAGLPPNEIWLTTGVAYKFVLTDSLGLNARTFDNITGIDPSGSASALAAQLAASGGSALVGFLQAGTGAVARTLQAKDRDAVSVKDFGAVGDGATDDTAAITAAYAAALAAGAALLFPAAPSGYAVSTVTFSGSDVFVNFEGSSRLKGIATGAQSAVLQITGRQMQIWNLQVDQNFNLNYTKGAVWWNSVSAGTPAQYNRIFGFKLFNAVNGLVYGDVIGGSAVSAAQSENTIYSLQTRAVQVPFVSGSQPNGFITLVSPILDCNPNEWAAQGGYNAATYAAAAYCFRNESAGNNHLVILGGEVLKTFATSGYGFTGGNVVIVGSTFEIAGPQGYIESDFEISSTGPGSMTCGGVANSAFNAFVVDVAATGIFYLDKFKLYRPATSSANSTASFIAPSSGSPALTVSIRNCLLSEWRWDATVPLVAAGITLRYFDNNFITVATRSNNIEVKATPVVVAAATVSVLDGDIEFLNNNAATVTYTLPAAASYTGRYLRISNILAQLAVSASSNVLPLGGTGTGTAILAATAGKWCEMQSDGTNWRILRAN